MPLSLTPMLLGHACWAYLSGALLPSSGFAYYEVQLAVSKSNTAARRLLTAAIGYLPALFIFFLTIA